MKCKQHSVVESYATWCMSVFGGGVISVEPKSWLLREEIVRKWGGGGGEDIIISYIPFQVLNKFTHYINQWLILKFPIIFKIVSQILSWEFLRFTSISYHSVLYTFTHYIVITNIVVSYHFWTLLSLVWISLK